MQTSLYKLTMLAAAAVFVVACGGGGSDDSAGNDGGGANPTPTATPTLTPTQAPDAPLEPEHKINPVQFGSDKLCATTTASELEASDAAEYYDFAATKALDSAKLHQYFSQQSPNKNTGQMREIAANPTSPAADEWFAQLGEIRDIHLVAAAQQTKEGKFYHPILWFSSTPDKENPYIEIDLQLRPGQSYYSAQIGSNWALNKVIAKKPAAAFVMSLNPMRYADDAKLRKRLPNTYCFHRGTRENVYFFAQPDRTLGLSCLYLKDNGSWITFLVKGEADDLAYNDKDSRLNIERIHQAQQAALKDTNLVEFNWLWVSKTRQQLAQHIDKFYQTNKFAKIDRSKTLTPYQEYIGKIITFHGPLAMNNYKLRAVTFKPNDECAKAPVFN